MHAYAPTVTAGFVTAHVTDARIFLFFFFSLLVTKTVTAGLSVAIEPPPAQERLQQLGQGLFLLTLAWRQVRSSLRPRPLVA
jgi:hypothetical protein